MALNVLSLVICLIVVVAGVWLANEIAEMRKIQDCVLMGRSGCAPLDLASHRHG